MEIPIFERIFSSPLPIPLIARSSASSGLIPSGRRPSRCTRVERLEHQVRIDRRGPVADQAGQVVDLLGLAGLRHEPDLQPGALADQVVMHSGDREQRGHRRALAAQVAVREDDDVHAAGHQLVGLLAHRGQPALHASGAVGHRPGHVDRAGLEDAVIDLPQLLQLRVPQDGLGHHQLVAVVGRLAQKVDLRADAGLEAHHDRLPQRVDRGVGDLGEELLEVAVQRRAHVGHHGQGHVVAHRPGGLGGVARHRHQEHVQVLLGPAEGQLLGPQRLHTGDAGAPLGQVPDVHHALLEPLAVGPPAGQLALDLGVGHDQVALQVDQEQLPGEQAALGLHLVGGHLEHAGLGGEHHPAVLGGRASVPGAGRCGRAWRRSPARR